MAFLMRKLEGNELYSMIEFMKRTAFLIIVIFLFSCTRDKNNISIPKDVIVPEEMVSLIIDFHIAEAALVDCQNKKEDVNNTTILYYNSILKKHKTTRAQFNNSMKFYSENVPLLQKIYEQVGDELSTLQSKERI